VRRAPTRWNTLQAELESFLYAHDALLFMEAKD